MDMYRHITLIAVFIFCFANTNVFAKELWRVNLGGEIKWHQVTEIGDLIASTNAGLVRIDQNTGQIAWRLKQLANLDRNALLQIEGSPFYGIQANNQFYMVDPFSGEVLFDSTDVDIQGIDHTYFVYDQGTVLLSGQSRYSNQTSIVLVELNSGKVLWQKTVDYKKIVNVVSMDSDHMMVLSLLKYYKVRKKDGGVVWEKLTEPSLGAVMNGPMKELLGNYIEDTFADVDFDMQSVWSYDQSKLIMLIDKSESSATGAVAFDPNTGEIVWETDYPYYIGKILPLKSGLLLMSERAPNGPAKTNILGFKVNLIDYQTGKGMLGKKGKGLRIKGGEVDYKMTSKGMLIAVKNPKKSFIYELDFATGAFTTKKPAKVKGYIQSLFETDKGLFCVTSKGVNVLDASSGKWKITKDIKANVDLAQQKGKLIYTVGKEGKNQVVNVVNSDSNQVSQFNKAPLAFQKETPESLELLDDGLFISSSQNIAKYDFSGNLQFQKYFPEPKERGYSKALVFGQALAFTALAAGSFDSAKSAAKDRNETDNGEYVKNMVDLGLESYGIASQAFQHLLARYKASTSYRDFMLILTLEGKRMLLKKVSKSTGKVLGALDMGAFGFNVLKAPNKNYLFYDTNEGQVPAYVADPVTQAIYVRTANSVLAAHSI
ncbi:PQQ-binding-like beta-propeller repeat protein [Marinibactrum halimedae]|uniref:PQQ-binding-like beta-propeller repeat protein n=1 Tax=Marinibactrum halimedae TaxID=1444977 RepID=A0AA37WNQ0_9GAMM|nr:PQQ-binding-like beta-propeller repeat protein [Marinibactrum halimedae]MCD9460700.1 PQQ-binding-like beta-propeller repeat protein [Marinibactrum halimedae]GLS25177.1 hypothetical protein GCM10007877_08910 [Marinibactrum halimedae]